GRCKRRGSQRQSNKGDWPGLDYHGARWHRILRQAGALIFVLILWVIGGQPSPAFGIISAAEASASFAAHRIFVAHDANEMDGFGQGNRTGLSDNFCVGELRAIDGKYLSITARQ